MQNGAIADVVTEGARDVVPAQVETGSSWTPSDGWVSTTQGDRAAREAGEVAAVVSCEVVVELGETNLWVSLDQDGTTSRPDLVEGAQPGQFPADLRVSAAGWYDAVYRKSHEPIAAGTYNATSAANWRYWALRTSGEVRSDIGAILAA